MTCCVTNSPESICINFKINKDFVHHQKVNKNRYKILKQFKNASYYKIKSEMLTVIKH